MTELLRWLQSSSALSEDNASFIEDLYSKYLRDPDSVDPSWQKTFAAVPESLDELRPSLTSVPPMPADQPSLEHRLRKQTAVDRLIDQYRTLGHQAADNNPL